MKNVGPVNIIYKKSINLLGNELIQIRHCLKENNQALPLSSIQILRLVLLSCLYAEISASDEGQGSSRIPDDLRFPELRDALEISFGEVWVNDYLGVSDSISESIRYDEAARHLQVIKDTPFFPVLLLYALELLDYSEREISIASRDRRAGIITKKKKESGVYYTPPDVAHYMVKACTDRLRVRHASIKECRFMDFSCGSGVFLIEILETVFRKDTRDFHPYLDFLSLNLYGIDISEYAVEFAKYAVLSHSAKNYGCHAVCVKQLLACLSHNIKQADATRLDEFLAANPDYPKSFDCIVGNPPYVGNSSGAAAEKGNLFIPFVYNLLKYSKELSVCSLVVPLSFSYNNQPGFRAIRSDMDNDDAEWRIEHYDRSPDSLFGDDVKSRACIIFRECGSSHRILTTGLLRWTSATRAQILTQGKSHADISDLSVCDYIPKISTPIEKIAYSKITSGAEPLTTLLCSHLNSSDHLLSVKGTAYNWICAYDHVPPGKDSEGRAYVSGNLRTYAVQSENELYFILALLNSVTTFWLWTAIGDGFHVTNRLFDVWKIGYDRFSGPLMERLARLGRDFSSGLLQYPTQSVNSGKTVTSYRHQPLLGMVLQIDGVIAQALHLPAAFPDYLHRWYHQIVSCGRENGDTALVRRNF